MVSRIKNSNFYLLILITSCIVALTACHQKETKPFRYQADWASIRSHYQTPSWFRDAKFGIFLHWGVYSVPALSTKYAKYMYYENHPIKKYHRVHYGTVDKFGYKDFMPQFKAEHFDANQWVSLFKESGARYVVPVAEHHDGFAMYNSHYTKWNSVNMGPKKDIVGLLAKACKSQGLKFGVSSHLANWRRYYSKQDPKADTSNPAYEGLYWKQSEQKDKVSKAFLQTWWNRTTDIIDQYKPDLLWFDFKLDQKGFSPVHKKILAYYYNKGLSWKKEVVFQDKNMKFQSFPNDLIVLDLERGRMDSIFPHPWQTDTSVGKRSWGYINDEEYKSAGYLIDELIDIVSKNGCLLLNIGPKADGTISPEAKKILEEMGVWLKLNGEAIYDTRPWKIYGEGPTKISSGNHTESENFENVATDLRFTTKGETLYATALGWPDDGKFIIKSLAKNNSHEKKKISAVEFISGNNEIRWIQTSEGLVINTKGEKPCEAAYSFRIRF